MKGNLIKIVKTVFTEGNTHNTELCKRIRKFDMAICMKIPEHINCLNCPLYFCRSYLLDKVWMLNI